MVFEDGGTEKRFEFCLTTLRVETILEANKAVNVISAGPLQPRAGWQTERIKRVLKERGTRLSVGVSNHAK